MKDKYGLWIKEDGWDIKGSWAIRFHGSNAGASNLQISQYREADDFDKAMGNKYKWHGKWYVNTWYPEQEKLFDSKQQAIKYAESFMMKHQKPYKWR